MTSVAGQTDWFDHPLVDDLIALVDGELDNDHAAQIGAHVEQCVLCRSLLADAGPPPTSDPAEPVATFTFTPIIRLAVSGEPLAGEVWQLEWAGAALLAAVLECTDGQATVVPVSRHEPQSATLAVAAEMREHSDAMYAWYRLRSTVPLGVFSYPVGSLSAASWRTVSEVLATNDPAPTASADGTPLSGGGAVPTADALFEAELAVSVALLADASWVPEASAALVPLRELFNQRSLIPTTAASATGIPAAAITELVRDRREATEQEAAALAALLQLPVERVRRPPALPSALIHAIERPAHRAQVRLRALQGGISEADARRRIASDALALSARTSRSERDVETWDELVRRLIDG